MAPYAATESQSREAVGGGVGWDMFESAWRAERRKPPGNVITRRLTRLGSPESLHRQRLRLLRRHLGPQLVHERPQHVHVVLEHVADQDVRHPILQIWVLADEPAEAEPVVELADQPAHPVHPAAKRVLPLAELGGRGVTPIEPLANGVRGHRRAGERQEYAGRVEWVEEPERVAAQDPAVAGRLARPVRILLPGPEAGASGGVPDHR